MAYRRVFVMAHATARARAIDAVRTAPEGYVVEIKPKTRSLEQNALLHALCAAAAQQARWAGRELDVTSWKRLFVDAYLRETGDDGVRVLPSLDGKGVVSVGEPTRSMSKAMMTELIEWILAWCAQNGVDTEEARREH